MSESELEQLIKRAIISTLTERSDLLENAVTEAILDIRTQPPDASMGSKGELWTLKLFNG